MEFFPRALIYSAVRRAASGREESHLRAGVARLHLPSPGSHSAGTVSNFRPSHAPLIDNRRDIFQWPSHRPLSSAPAPTVCREKYAPRNEITRGSRHLPTATAALT